MRFIQEQKSRMKKLSEHCHKGFVSSWFLSILLSVTMVLSVMTLNDQSRMQTVMNMKKNSACFQQEAAVMSDIRCHLINGTLSEGTYQTGSYSYRLDVQADRIYAQIVSDYPETLDIVFNAETQSFVSMSPIRPYYN